jgi:acyl phosphate:glycerol-3-phosphate acyltransferase
MAIDIAFIHFIAIIFGYILGSIPFGLVITRLTGQDDIRKIGSGNIGATNVLRTGNKVLALATLLLDASKGAAAALTLGSFDPLAGLIAGGFAVIGHNFPIWLNFIGGKGVATTLGVLIALAWPVGTTACITWILVAFCFRISSLAALVALSTSPFYAWWLADDHGLTVLAILLAILSLLRHHENIVRLMNGQESKIGNG